MTAASVPRIFVRQLTYRYPGHDHPAVQALNFEVRPGEVFGFLGPSGAGKSTTQNILIGHLRGFEGDVQVLGKPLRAWDGDLYRHIGVSFELPNHYLKLTARENLEYFRALYGDEATSPALDVLARVGLAEHADKRVAEFSKGMKNRLNFARSLMHCPTLWFLDEPTAGLDPVNALRVREIVKDQQARGVTTVLTTHDMTTADLLCDRVAFIVDGEIAVVDTPSTLRQRYGEREVCVSWRGENAGEARFPLDGLADNGAFRDALRHPQLTSVHSLEASLDDVFVEVTGRSLG
ncbi:MAG: ABC transporter ATP-binding protein [Pseudomonadota bacterium]